MNTQRWRIISAVLLSFTFLTRFVSLSYPTDNGTPIFDEKHYVPQTWQMVTSWQNPAIGGIENNPGYGLVVHPPLGKQIAVWAQALFGYAPLGWRITSALFGVAIVLLIAVIARRITRSDFVGMLAGILALFDGVLFVSARTGMLDNYQLFFIVLGTYFLLRDDSQVKSSFETHFTQGTMPSLGPRFGIRWWRFGAGLCLGATLSIKWSGLYYMAAVGLTLVVVDYLRRRHYGVEKPLRGTFLLSALPSFVAVVIVPALFYVFSWRAWFASETGVHRHHYQDDSWGPFSGIVNAVRNLAFHHAEILNFHTTLTNSAGYEHPWESKPWMWLVGLRPVLYYSATDDNGHTYLLYLFGTPIIWWLTIPVLLFGLYRLFWKKDWRWTVPLVGYAAGFLPWLLNPDRQMYFFYAVNLAPFLLLGIALCLGQLTRWTATIKGTQRPVGLYVAITYMALVAAFFMFFLPMLSGMPMNDFDKFIHIWFNAWS